MAGLKSLGLKALQPTTSNRAARVRKLFEKFGPEFLKTPFRAAVLRAVAYLGGHENAGPESLATHHQQPRRPRAQTF
ncbi:hypothetical protein A8B82_15995 [Sulfitobacter sp. EhC04]|nr:hypothetical protein A8B82_15995 [Sulfitobacter sp. EhC04]